MRRQRLVGPVPTVVKVLAILVLTVAMVGGGAGIIAAQEGSEEVTVSPAIFERLIEPGDKADIEIDVRNTTSEQKTLYASGADFLPPSDESGQPEFSTEEATEQHVSSWLTFNQSVFTVEPNETMTTGATIRVPETAQPGGHYGLIVFSEQPPAADGAATPQVSVGQELATTLLVTVGGELIESGEFLEVRTARKIFWGETATIVVRFQNTGNVHLKPRGIINVNTAVDEKAAVLEFNPAQLNVLPDSVRRYELTWRPEKSLGFIPIFGRFWIEPFIGYGDPLVLESGLPAEEFWMIPLWFFLVIFALILGFMALIYGSYKVGKRRGRSTRS